LLSTYGTLDDLILANKSFAVLKFELIFRILVFLEISNILAR